MTANPSIDPRVAAGMKAQLAKRTEAIAKGARRLGWKAGFGAPAAIEKFKLAGPLAGYMLDSSVIESGARVSLAGWTKPVAEPEVAIHIGARLADGRNRDAVRNAIAALGPAIELADLNPPPEDVAAILGGNIFHRHVIIGPADGGRAGARLDSLSGVVGRAGQADVAVSDLEANTGRLVDIVAHMADTLAACGEWIEAGDVIIAGSVVPPLFLTADDKRVSWTLGGIGAVSVEVG